MTLLGWIGALALTPDLPAEVPLPGLAEIFPGAVADRPVEGQFYGSSLRLAAVHSKIQTCVEVQVGIWHIRLWHIEFKPEEILTNVLCPSNWVLVGGLQEHKQSIWGGCDQSR